MKRIFLIKLYLILFVGILLFVPTFSSALSITYLDPKYTASDFLTLDFQTNAIAFDADRNLYTSNRVNDNTGIAEILMLDAATGYTTSSVYMSYATTARNINGLDFNYAGSLLVSEANADRDSGIIREIDTATLSIVNTILLPDFRPTGIAGDSAGNIYFPGRLKSDTAFGNIYKIDLIGNLDILLSGFAGTGIEVDESGSGFASTPRRDVSPLLSRSIYTDSLFPTSPLLATFDNAAEELTFDSYGNLYVLEMKDATDTPKIIRISPIPEPSTILLLGCGLFGLAAFRKKFKNK